MFKEAEQLDINSDEQNQRQNGQEESHNNYGSTEYWQQRYLKTQGQRFDWLQNHQTVEQIITRELGANKNIRILNIGCGNGQIQDHLYSNGYHHIHNNDISKEVIKQMNNVKEERGQKEMVYEVMDVTAMKYADRSFDLVLDKSTIDALLCSQNPYLNTAKMLESVSRVLTDKGLYLIISYAAPENRMAHLVRPHVNFKIKVEQLVRINEQGDKLVHYAYICWKGEPVHRDQAWMAQFYRKLKEEEDRDYSVNDNEQ